MLECYLDLNMSSSSMHLDVFFQKISDESHCVYAQGVFDRYWFHDQFDACSSINSAIYFAMVEPPAKRCRLRGKHSPSLSISLQHGVSGAVLGTFLLHSLDGRLEFLRSCAEAAVNDPHTEVQLVWGTRLLEGSLTLAAAGLRFGSAVVIHALYKKHSAVATFAENVVKLWSVVSGRCVMELQHEAALHFAEFSSDGASIATVSGASLATVSSRASLGDVLKIWNAFNGQCMLTSKQETRICRMAFAPDGASVAIWYHPIYLMTVLSAISGECLATLQLRADAFIVFAPDSMSMLHRKDLDLKVTSTVDYECLFTLPHVGYVLTAAFAPNGASILTVSFDSPHEAHSSSQSARMWSVASGECVVTLPLQAKIFPVGHRSPIAFAPDGAYFAICQGNSTKIWSTATFENLLTVQHVADELVEVRSIGFSPDSASILTLCDNGLVKIWSTSSGVCLFTLQQHGGAESAVLAPDGASIITTRPGTPDYQALAFPSSVVSPSVKIWSVSSGQCLLTLEYSHWAVFAPSGCPIARGH